MTDHESGTVDMEWYDSGACADYEDIFFPEALTIESDREKSVREHRAVEICGHCSVRDQCLVYVLTSDEDIEGTWAGFTEGERRQVKHKMSESAIELTTLRAMPFEATRQLASLVAKEPRRPQPKPTDNLDPTYPSELNPEHWEGLRSLFTVTKPRTGGQIRSSASIVDAYLYKLRTDCRWTEMPPDFPSHATVSRRVKEWQETGVLDILLLAAEERWTTQNISFRSFAKQRNTPLDVIQRLTRALHMVLPVEPPTPERKDSIPLLPPSYRQELDAELKSRIYEPAREDEERLKDVVASLDISFRMALNRLAASGISRSELAKRVFQDGRSPGLAINSQHIQRLRTVVQIEREQEGRVEGSMTATEISATYGIERSLISFIKKDLGLTPAKPRQEETNIVEEVFSPQDVERMLNHPRGVKTRTPKAPENVRSFSAAARQLLKMSPETLRKWVDTLGIETEEYMFGPTVAPGLTLDAIEQVRRHREQTS